MRTFWILCACLVCGGFVLAAPPPSLAAPDYWVGMGGSAVDPSGKPVLTATGELYKAVVMVGNSGTPGQYKVQVYLRVKVGNNLVCGASTTVAPPVAGHAVEALEFDLVVPGGKLIGKTPLAKPHLPVQYTFEAEVSQSDTLPPGVYEEGNVSNNKVTGTRSLPGGGTPTCKKLQ